MQSNGQNRGMEGENAMDVETIRDAIRNLSGADRARLMAEVGPDLCRAAMQTPDVVERMMPRCEEMMQDPEIQRFMHFMMQRMMGGGKQNG
jgi:DNA-binding transcriptional regulator YbjK